MSGSNTRGRSGGRSGGRIAARLPLFGGPAAGNLCDTTASARKYLVRPALELGKFDLHPRAGACKGAAADLHAFREDADFDRDFDGNPKEDGTTRGAYAGGGTGSAWRVERALKPLPE
ncbi:MAG: hypothetical protein HY720_16360 [Planctomycetes bacterium]|nr:hypothetical protein [Planctomycetota bacterium]